MLIDFLLYQSKDSNKIAHPFCEISLMFAEDHSARPSCWRQKRIFFQLQTRKRRNLRLYLRDGFTTGNIVNHDLESSTKMAANVKAGLNSAARSKPLPHLKLRP